MLQNQRALWTPFRPLIFIGAFLVLFIFGSQFVLNTITDPAQFAGCSPVSWDSTLDPAETFAVWQNKSLTPPQSLLSTLTPKDQKVLGTSTEEKWIEIDLSDQKLIAHQGDQVFLESKISSGLWNKTPVGEYRIWYKISSTKMEGGSRLNQTYYYLPNVPYAMFFKGSYGIHGTYWHNNFGTPRSHGCVNAPTSIAEKLFYWTAPHLDGSSIKSVKASDDNPGTLVIIHD